MILSNIQQLEEYLLGKCVLIDTNIIIYLTDYVQSYFELSRRLFELIEQGSISGVISVVSIAEVMSGPLKDGFPDKAVDVREYLLHFPNLVCQEVTVDLVAFLKILLFSDLCWFQFLEGSPDMVRVLLQVFVEA